VIAVGGGLGALAACGLTVPWRQVCPAVGPNSAGKMEMAGHR
jgi:hypothetical protein